MRVVSKILTPFSRTHFPSSQASLHVHICHLQVQMLHPPQAAQLPTMDDALAESEPAQTRSSLSRSTRIFVCKIPVLSQDPHANVEAAFVTLRVARRQTQQMRSQHCPTNGTAHKNHHTKALSPSVIRNARCTITPSPTLVGIQRTCSIRSRNPVVRIQFGEGRRAAARLCTMVVQCWFFGNLACVQHPPLRAEPRKVVVSIVRDAALDDQLTVLRLCLWFGAFSGQLILLLDGFIVPLGWPVFPGRLRVRYMLKDTRPFDHEFRPLIGDHNLHRPVRGKPGFIEVFPSALREVLTIIASFLTHQHSDNLGIFFTSVPTTMLKEYALSIVAGLCVRVLLCVFPVMAAKLLSHRTQASFNVRSMDWACSLIHVGAKYGRLFLQPRHSLVNFQQSTVSSTRYTLLVSLDWLLLRLGTDF